MYNGSEHILKDIYSDTCIYSKLISGITMRIRNVDMHIILYVSVVHICMLTHHKFQHTNNYGKCIRRDRIV